MTHFNPNTPHELPLLNSREIVLTNEILLNLVEARSELAELKGATSHLANPFSLISPPALIKESLSSNAIENIHTTVESVMQDAANEDKKPTESNKEVLNYRKALTDGFFSNLPVATRLVLSVHKNVLEGKPGGYFRQQQNAIKNFATNETIYTPPRATQINSLMGDLDSFLNSDNGVDPLIKAVIAHYQFEAIHPFTDGNGRTGRILFVLYLCDKKLLNHPALFLSGYLLANRQEYYDRLLAVTAHGDWENYLIFMLKGIAAQARKTGQLGSKTIRIAKQLEDQIKNLPGNVQAHDLVEELFWFPYITPSLLAKNLEVHFTTANRYLESLKEVGILKDLGMIGKNHYYSCPQIINIYE